MRDILPVMGQRQCFRVRLLQMPQERVLVLRQLLHYWQRRFVYESAKRVSDEHAHTCMY